MRNFRLITNAYKDKDLHLSRRIVSYIEDKGGRAGISVSNIEGVVAEDFPLKDIPGDTECIMVLGGRNINPCCNEGGIARNPFDWSKSRDTWLFVRT